MVLNTEPGHPLIARRGTEKLRDILMHRPLYVHDVIYLGSFNSVSFLKSICTPRVSLAIQFPRCYLVATRF